MIGYFKERNSFQVPALLFLTLVLKLALVYHPHTDLVSRPGGLLAPWLDKAVLPRLQPAFLVVLSGIIIFFSALFANFQLSAGRMFSRHNLLVALSIVLFTSLFPSTNQLSATTLLLPVLVLLFQQITRLYNAPKPRPVIVNIGIIMGAGYLLYHPFIWLLPCCFISLGSMRPFKLAEWLLLLVGFVTPAYFILSYEFLTGHWHPQKHLLYWNFYRSFPAVKITQWISIAVALIWLAAATLEWQKQIRRMLIQNRKNWYQLIFMGLFILPMAIIPVGNGAEAVTLLAFPAGSFAANAFASQEKSLGSLLLFWLIICAIAVVCWKYTSV